MKSPKLKRKTPFTILQDDREKRPWDLSLPTKVTRLETGDYTIKGMEKVVCVEKKSSWSEISVNISNKKYRENFLDELRRLTHYPIRAIFVNENHNGITKPSHFSRAVTHETMIHWIQVIQLEYDIHIYPLGPDTSISRRFVENWFKTVWEFNRQGRLML